MIRVLPAVLVLLAGGVRAGPPAGSARPADSPTARLAPAVVSYLAPVPTPLHVVRPFQAPTTPYGPGHRGVDLATTAGQTVRAAAAGVVRFAGPVAGRGVVVLAHADGVTTEYEPVLPLVHAGAVVARGAAIGRIDGSHGTCPPGGCLHWGAKRDDTYFDPLSLLRPLGPVRLLPWSPAEDP